MYPGRMIVSGGSSENLLHEGKVQCPVLRNNMGLDKKNAPALCFAGCMCAIMIAAVAFCIVFPGVVEWIGIYAGLVFFVLVGMGIGAAVAVAAVAVAATAESVCAAALLCPRVRHAPCTLRTHCTLFW